MRSISTDKYIKGVALYPNKKANKRFFSSMIKQYIRKEKDMSFPIMYREDLVSECDINGFLDIAFKHTNLSVKDIRDDLSKGNTLPFFKFLVLIMTTATVFLKDSKQLNIVYNKFANFQLKYILLALFNELIKNEWYQNNVSFQQMEEQAVYIVENYTDDTFGLFLSYGFKRHHNAIFSHLTKALTVFEIKSNITHSEEQEFGTILHQYIAKRKEDVQSNCKVNFNALLHNLMYNKAFVNKVKQNPELLNQVKRHLAELNIYFRFFEIYKKVNNENITFDIIPEDYYLPLDVLFSHKDISNKDCSKIIKLLLRADLYYLHKCVEFVQQLLYNKIQK